jgi:hypothetical protein
MTDFLAEKRNEIAARLNELKPLVEEADRLQAALDALDGASKQPAATRSRKPAARKPRSGSGTGKRGRPRGSGKRAAEALRLVTAQPGITISELAPLMGIHQNYLYRVLPGLQADGKVRKEGRGWYPAE